MEFFRRVLFLAWIFPGIAQAFTLVPGPDGSPDLGWSKRSLTIDYNFSNCSVSSDALTAMAKNAFDVWNNVPTVNLSVRLGQAITDTAASLQKKKNSGNPAIVCDSTFTQDVFGPNDPMSADFVPAATELPVLDGTHHSVFNVLILNSEDSRMANIKNIDANQMTLIIAHEVGHVLGLGHSADSHALMYYDATAKEILSLSQDDIEGITWLYPRNEVSGGFFGCGSANASTRRESSQDDSGGILEVGLFLGFLMFARKVLLLI